MSEEILAISNERFANAIYQYEVTPPDSTITEEELRILGLNPAEVFRTVPIYPTDRNNAVVNNDDFYLDDSDLDDIVEHNIHFGNNGDIFPMIVQYSRAHRGNISENYLTSDDDDDDTEEEIEGFEDEVSSPSSDEDFDERQVSISTDSSSRFSTSDERDRTPLPIMDSDQSTNSWDLNDECSVGSLTYNTTNTSYSEDSTSSSGSNINCSNDTNSSGSTTSSPSSSSSN